MNNPRPVIVNTTVISNFAVIGQLEQLRRLFKQIYIPPAVYQEIQQGLDEGYRFYTGIEAQIAPWSSTGWIQLTPFANDDELRDLQALPRKLHEGEAACLVIAKHRKWLFLTDDAAARKQASAWNINYSGTLGCLVLMIKRDQISLQIGNHYLNIMQQNNYRSPFSDLSSLI